AGIRDIDVDDDREPGRAAVHGVFDAADIVLVLLVEAREGEDDIRDGGEVERPGDNKLDLVTAADVGFDIEEIAAAEHLGGEVFAVKLHEGSSRQVEDAAFEAFEAEAVDEHPALVGIGLEVI